MLREAVCAGIIAAALQALPGAAAEALQPGAKKPPAAVDRARQAQQRIYETRGEEVPGGYVTDRSLLSYASALLPEFDAELAALGPDGRWLDIGAGQGRALLDYYGERYDAMHAEGRERRGNKAQGVAISIEDRRSPEWQQVAARLEPGKIRYLHGRRLREYSPEELGRFDLATDVYGGFSYTSDLSRFMENILALLKTGGSFHTLLINVQPEQWSGRAEAAFQTEIFAADGRPLKICAWLRSIGCVEVSCAADPRSETPIERYRIRKTCDTVRVPALEALQFTPGTPPARQFRRVGSGATAMTAH